MLKKMLLFLLVVLIVIQFFHPKKNITEGKQLHSIAMAYAVPDPVNAVLEKACNDCHSNNTRYPWYSKLQPVDWWLDNHIQGGKKHLNLDEFSTLSLSSQYRRLDEIVEQVKKNEMPLASYTWIHKDAILTDAEKNTLINWAEAIRDTMQMRYPPDSLKRKKQP